MKAVEYLAAHEFPEVAQELAQFLHCRRRDMRTLLSFLIASSMVLVAQPDGREIVRRSLSAADRNWQARQSYTYMARDEERHLDAQGRVKSTDVDVSKAVLANGDTIEQAVSHNGDTIEQAVSHNGGPPTAAKRKKDEENLRKRRSETSLERAARLHEEKENRAFIDEIPYAFNFRLIGEQVVRGHPAYIVELTSRPEFHARSKYGSMFSKVTGTIWVDRQDFGWVKVDVDVAEPFSMGLFMARVQPGSHILFEQMRLADGVWLPDRIEIKANAKILFVKNYAMYEVITYSEYRPAQPTEVASTRDIHAPRSDSGGL